MTVTFEKFVDSQVIDGAIRLHAIREHKRSFKGQMEELEKERFQQAAFKIMSKRKDRFSRWWSHIA